MSHTQVLQEFKRVLISFLDELIEQFPQEGDLVMARIFINDQVPISEVMTTFIHRLLPVKEKVSRRDVNFFLGDGAMSIFQNLDKGKVNYFKRLWQSSALDDDDREQIWKWYDHFIRLAEKYQKI